jgi:hypothetical protein
MSHFWVSADDTIMPRGVPRPMTRVDLRKRVSVSVVSDTLGSEKSDNV